MKKKITVRDVLLYEATHPEKKICKECWFEDGRHSQACSKYKPFRLPKYFGKMKGEKKQKVYIDRKEGLHRNKKQKVVQGYICFWRDLAWQVVQDKPNPKSAKALKVKVYPCIITYNLPLK